MAPSLVAFAVVYFAVFGAGAYYVLRLLSHPPVPDEARLQDVVAGPIRTAGIAPAPAAAARRGEPRPAEG